MYCLASRPQNLPPLRPPYRFSHFLSSPALLLPPFSFSFSFSLYLSPRLFFLFDKNSSATVDFAEFHCTLAALSSGTVADKLRFAFDAVDVDSNGWLDRDEITKVRRPRVERRGE